LTKTITLLLLRCYSKDFIMSVKIREKKLSKGGVSLYLDIYHQGKRTYQFLDITIHPKEDDSESKKEKLNLAKQVRNNIELELLSEGTNYTPQHLQRIDFFQFAQNYIDSYKKGDKRMVKCAIQHFANFVDEDRLPISRLSSRLCEEFQEYLIDSKTGLSGETPKNYFARFKKVLKALIRDGYLKINPAQHIIFKGRGNDVLRKEVLTGNELKTLSKTKCGNELVKRAFLFCCYTGLGVADLKLLKWSNFKSGRLVINRAKTGVEINIPLSETALNLIGEKGKKTDVVFDLKISSNGINKNLRYWLERSKIDKKITFYCARHTYATLLLMNGANLKTVSDCMGQTNTAHTIKYLNHIEGLKDQAINSLPKLD
jgi:integrase